MILVSFKTENFFDNGEKSSFCFVFTNSNVIFPLREAIYMAHFDVSFFGINRLEDFNISN